MSRQVGRGDSHDVLDLDSGLDALRRSPDLSGPVEPLDDHEHGNDHFALVYEDREEQFAAVIPFVRQGLERGERCMYIADENSRTEVLDEMRDRGIDVDAALESGALSVHTKRDTYCRGGSFDPDDMIAFLEDAIDEAREEYEALRVTGEMTWVFGPDPDIDDLVEYEGKLNDLLPSEDGIALCQYNRNRFPAEVLRDIVRTHPHLVYDNTVSQNFYYTPPEEFFGPEQPSREIDRMLGVLSERTRAKEELRSHKQYLRELHETTADTDLSFREMVEQLLELGRERFGLRGGALAHLPSWDGDFVAEVTVGPEMPEEPGVLPVQPGESCFCRQAIQREEATAVADVVEHGWDDDVVYEEFGLRTYFGIRVTAGSEPYGTLWFYDTSPRDEPFTEDERTFLQMMGQWVSNELERTERNRAQRELYEITANSDLSFDEKVDELLELGRDRFGLDAGFLLRKEGDRFRVVKTRGTDLEEGAATLCANPDQYCKQTIQVDVPVGVEDTAAEGWDDDPLYRQYDLGCYLGTKVTDSTGVYGSVCFADTGSRDVEFTDAEYTFLDLIGQWLSYELEREERERYLREQNEITADADRSFEEKLQALFDLGCERFDLELGAMARIDSDTDRFEIEHVSGDHAHLEPGTELPLSETYCSAAAEAEGPASVADPLDAGYEDATVHREFGLESYIGTYVEVDGAPDRTFFFVSSEPREAFSEAERAFHRLMGQWIQYELERRRHESRLQSKNDRLESFASMLAHELRNPVQIGQIYSEQLPEDVDAEAVEYVTDAFDRIEDMIDVMLVLTRGREAVDERAPVSLAAVARDAWDEVDATGDATLDVAVDRTIQADETYVSHLLRNLLENAVEHGSTSPRSQAREDAVEHGGSDVAVTVGELPSGFYVADDGVGIPDGERAAVFEAGYTTASDNGGTGLGLAFVEELADVYGWDVSLTESEAGGARFEFRGIDHD
ncbi:MEDS domain-containing protein [Halorussus sp. AFM4]|uniref:MEDS domain-containing protein n=1 Tax=Halorussus sp. AFM4 TaxID=3421651 RepID=UPI003EB7337E